MRCRAGRVERSCAGEVAGRREETAERNGWRHPNRRRTLGGCVVPGRRDQGDVGGSGEFICLFVYLFIISSVWAIRLTSCFLVYSTASRAALRRATAAGTDTTAWRWRCTPTSPRRFEGTPMWWRTGSCSPRSAAPGKEALRRRGPSQTIRILTRWRRRRRTSTNATAVSFFLLS